MDRKKSSDRTLKTALRFSRAGFALVDPPEGVQRSFARRFATQIRSDAPTLGMLRFQPVSQSPVAADAIPPTFSWQRSRPLWGSFEQGRLLITDGASVSISDLARSSTDYFLADETLAETTFFERTFLLVPLLEHLKTFGLFYVHASFVVRGEEGVLILGRGGSGKTTLSHRLVERGARWVSDDNLLLEINEVGKPVLTPFEREFSLHPDLASRIQLKRGYRESGKHRIGHADWPREQRIDSGIPTVILDLEGVTKDPSPSARSAILDRLLRENPTVWLEPHQSRALRAYETLVRGCRTLSCAGDWRHLPALTYFWSDV